MLLHEAETGVELVADPLVVLQIGDVEPLHRGRGEPGPDAVDEGREVRETAIRTAVLRVEGDVGGGCPSGPPALGEDAGPDDVLERERSKDDADDVVWQGAESIPGSDSAVGGGGRRHDGFGNSRVIEDFPPDASKGLLDYY